MNETVLGNQNSTSLKKLFVILSAVALGIRTLLFLLSFLGYEYSYLYGINDVSLTIDFPSFESLFYSSIDIAAYVLLFIYITFFHEKSMLHIFMTIVFGIFATQQLLYLFNNVSVINVFFGIPFAVFCVLYGIGLIKGNANKLFLIIAMGIGVLSLFVEFVSDIRLIFDYLRNLRLLYLFRYLLSSSADTVLYVTIFLFCFKNEIPALIKPADNANI